MGMGMGMDMRVAAATVLLAWLWPLSGAQLTFHAEDPRLHATYADKEPVGARSPMKLHMMPEKGLAGMGAVCLDGSDAGFYFAPASKPTHAKSWHIHFQGGGWCYDELDCWRRTHNFLGSSATWAKYASGGGIMSDDCEVNPDFCEFNRVHLIYCDGFSFAGDRSDALVVTGLDGQRKPLYFRGKRILDAVLETLFESMGLQKAEEVLLSGCSAGGLATFLHTDYVHSQLLASGAPLKTFKAVPISGFFLAHATIEDAPIYVEEMKRAGFLANVTESGGLNQRCLAAMPRQEQWKCSFAAHAYHFIQAPVFVLNSALDSWQTKCIYSSRSPDKKLAGKGGNGACNAVPGWKDCMENPENCNATQVEAMNKYMGDFREDLLASNTSRKAGNGAFIHSCHTHCAALHSELWKGIHIKGVSMQQALSQWWRRDAAPASSDSHTDCMYGAHLTPHACNPTCPDHTIKGPLLI